MPIFSKHDAYHRANDILRKYDEAKANYDKKLEGWKKEGVTPKKQTIEKLQRELDIQRKAAVRGMDMLRTDFREYLTEKTRPFSIRKQNIDGIKQTVITSLSTSDRNFLESLKYIRLSPEELKIYAKQYREDQNTAMCRALDTVAQQWGYETIGLVTDVQKEMQSFDNHLHHIMTALQPINEADTDQAFNNDFVRSVIDQALKDSYEFNDDGTLREQIEIKRKPETIEEEISDMLNRPDPNEKAVDEFGQQLEFARGLNGEKYAQDMMIAEAQAQASRIIRDAQANTGTAEAVSPKSETESEIPHSGEVWGSRS